MGRDQMRNLEAFKIGTGAVNEFEYQQHQGELAEQLQHQRDEQNSEPEATPTEAERIEKIMADAHEKVEERKRRGRSSYSSGKSETKKARTKKSATRGSTTKKSALKRSAAKRSTKKSAKKSAARKSSAVRSSARKSAAKKSAKRSITRKSASKRSPSKKSSAKKSTKARKR